MKQLIVGYGEIGKSVHLVVGEADILDKNTKTDASGYDIMHICFGYSDEFVSNVQDYVEEFKPKYIIIWSTVPIGTTKQIRGAVHSPVEGKHPDIDSSIRIMPRWLGYNDPKEGNFFAEFFSTLNMTVKRVPNSDFTEALKLLSTTEYGLNIEFARYKQQVAQQIGMDYKLTKEWNMDYNNLYRDLNLLEFKKFILDPPDGPKGGHCVTPNARLLYEQHPGELTKIVGEL